ncbi:MAG: MBOAT family protein [Deltaproteobacteria bacterium]|nr:MBOAT family protein [Deltaproteobacteria bacterium]MBN2673279.1 MBOAT family protein [Deltaproteobacteria bacterium]
MAFNSIQYAILFLIAFGGFWLLGERPRLRILFLLAASYVFYASWNPVYLGLIVLSSSLDFVIGGTIHRTNSAMRRKLLLATSLVINLGILCTFKYFNFFAREFTALMGVFDVQVTPWKLEVLLPVGISFYTFQSLSYTIDIYKKELEPAKWFFQYLLFVAFFPQLVAGPIVRAKKLLPQFWHAPRVSNDEGSRAIFLIAFGLVKKVVIADYIGGHLVDPVFSNPQMYSGIETLAASYGYAFQIYADFSAYSDIAIGSAALLGFEIPINFNAPYRATDLRDFWQRWHISLSSWLRDYLYIPMGGSKKGTGRTYFNLMATMVIGGLWHGASLTFVFWGAIHGLALVLTRVIQRLKLTAAIPPRIAKLTGIVLTFHVVCAAWIFFRSPDFETALLMFKTIATGGIGIANMAFPALAVLLAAVCIHQMPENWMEQAKKQFARIPAIVQAALVIGMIIAADKLAQTDVAPFIYFQF